METCIQFCSDIVKERLSSNALSHLIKHGCTTVNLQANAKILNGNTSSPRMKIFKSVSSAVLGLHWAHLQALLGLWT